MRAFKMDFHVHSDFSPDSQTPMVEMIEHAIEIGVTDLCFTDHIDLDYDLSVPQGDWLFDQKAYFQSIETYRKRYPSLKIYAGVELGLQPHLGKRYMELLQPYDYDFIIGSTHTVSGHDLYRKEFFNSQTPLSAIRTYYEELLKSIEGFNGYQVIGHLDLYTRYDARTRKVLFKDYFDWVEVLLKKLIELGKGIEVNSGGFRYQLEDNNPSRELLKLYKELGGEVITLGSDAHGPEALGYRYEDNIELLKSLGFQYLSVFEKQGLIMKKII